jgi:hypothetical protein
MLKKASAKRSIHTLEHSYHAERSVAHEASSFSNPPTSVPSVLSVCYLCGLKSAKTFGKISFPFEIQLTVKITQTFERFVHGESAFRTAAV